MNPLVEWILFFAVLAALATFISTRYKSFNVRLIVIHIGLIVSIILMTFVGTRLTATFQTYPFIFFCVSVTASILLLKKLSALYIVSSIVQEFCILLAAVLVGVQIGMIWAAIITAIIYSLAHIADPSQWGLKLLITFTWGICSIVVYSYGHQPMINFALHILGGSLFIRMGLLYYGQGEWARKVKF